MEFSGWVGTGFGNGYNTYNIKFELSELINDNDLKNL